MLLPATCNQRAAALDVEHLDLSKDEVMQRSVGMTASSSWLTAPLQLCFVIWDPEHDRSRQLGRWTAVAASLPSSIRHIQDAPARDVDAFFRRQLVRVVFDANRLEGTISRNHLEGPTKELIAGFLTHAMDEPESVPWDSEGSDDASSSSSRRQLFQSAMAAKYLLCDHISDPLSIELITEAHRIMMTGSYVDKPANILAAGICRQHAHEKVFAGVHQFLEPGRVLGALDHLVNTYEKHRHQSAVGMHPVALATYLFHEMISIHPFQNGNGRLCRLLLTWSLLKDGFPFPITLSSGHTQSHRHYLHAIERARGTNHRDGVKRFGELNVMTLDSVDRVVCNFFEIQPSGQLLVGLKKAEYL